MSFAGKQLDLNAVREKYRAERDKRVRQDGNEQYQEVVGDFAYFVDDPYVEGMAERAPQSARSKWSLLVVALAACYRRCGCCRRYL